MKLLKLLKYYRLFYITKLFILITKDILKKIFLYFTTLGNLV